MRQSDVHRLLVPAALVLVFAACGDHLTGQAGGPTYASPSPSLAAIATGDCVALAKINPVTVPPLIETDLGNGLRHVTSAEGGYTLFVPSAWLVTAASAGGTTPQFAQVHFSSYDQRTAPTPRPEAGMILPPEVGIHLDLELWANPDHLAPARYAQDVRIGPDQIAVLPGTAVTVAGQAASRFTIQDERRFQPSNGPLIARRRTRAVWLVPTLRDDRMLVIAATPAENSLMPAVEGAVATLAIAPGIRPERPVSLQRSGIIKHWTLDKDGKLIPGRRVEAKLMTYAEASAAMMAPHTADQKGPSGVYAPRIDHDPEDHFWVVVVNGPDLPQGRGGAEGAATPPPTAWIMGDQSATRDNTASTGTQFAGAGPATPAWPLGFDQLPDRCR